MICPDCRVERHTDCPGGTRCCCQHRTDRQPAPPCNVVGCDHTQPGECRIVRCATCDEPYDGTESPPQHIARAHLAIEASYRRKTRGRW